ncbi:MAG TPA: hypothetical protein VD863_20385 [Bradyrhizobium sp.]|nr:hypothetical protein [Bradyrhizobium sp.]
MITDNAGGLFAILNIVGPLLLLAALIYGVMHYRRSARMKQMGDQKTRTLYQQEDR